MINKTEVYTYSCDGCRKDLDGDYGAFVIERGRFFFDHSYISLANSLFCDKACFDAWHKNLLEIDAHNKAHPGFVGMGM